jgi:hypothetical protein
MAVTKRTPKKAGKNAEMASLARDLGVTLKQGKITARGERYLLTAGGLKKQVVVGDVIDPSALRKLTGKDVVAAVSGSTVVAVSGARGLSRKWIVCYIPADPFAKRVRPEVQNALVEKYVELNIIPEKFADVLREGI